MGSLCSSPAPEPTIESGRRTRFEPPASDESVQKRRTGNPAISIWTASTTSTTLQVKICIFEYIYKVIVLQQGLNDRKFWFYNFMSKSYKKSWYFPTKIKNNNFVTFLLVRYKSFGGLRKIKYFNFIDNFTAKYALFTKKVIFGWIWDLMTKIPFIVILTFFLQ